MERLLSLTLCFLILCSPTFAKDSSREKSHDHHNSKHKHSVPPQAHLRVDSKPCQSPCTATLDASKSRAHKGATIVKYIFDYNDGSPLFESTSPIVTHEYSFIKETLSKKHKHKKNIKEFHPTVFVIDSNNKKSKSDREKVRVIAQTDTTPVNQAPVAKLVLNPSSGIAPLQVTLDASGSSDDKGIVLYTFIVGNGEIISTTEPVLNVVYSSANVFNPQVVVKDQEGLESSISASVSVTAPPVNQAPIASLSATPLLGDAPLLVTFDSSASSDDKGIVNRIYLFGDGQSLTTTEAVVSHLYQQSGNYTASVEIFDQENLSSTKSVAIQANTPNTAPMASVSVDKVRANPGASLKFDGSASTDAENNIASYSLSNSVLGINQTNTTGIFDVVINQSGSFDFILEVTDSMNLISTANVNVSVNAPPIALLSADKISGVAPLTVTFDSSASSDDVGIIKRDYQFAPNVFALNAGSTVSYTYNEPGVYPAKIQIHDGENLVSEATVEITVTAPEIKTPPIAWFQIEADPSTGLVRLKNQAIAGSSNIISVSYLVNNQVSLSSAIYAYSEASFQAEGGLRYDIKQIVTDEQNQTSEETISVVMDETQQAPVPQFTIAQSNVNQVFLNALYSFDLLNSTTSMKINWGDQTPEETLSSHFASHNYQNAGTYSVTLTLENAQNLTSSLTREITITNSAPEALNPVANFSAIYDEGAKHVRLFSEYSASPNGEILSYFWEYGDGQVGYGQQSVHFYSVGMYLTRLTVTDSMGIRASQVQQIIITENGPPIISGVDCRSFGLYGECDFFAAHKDKQLDRVDVDWGDGSIDSFPVENNEWQTFDAIGHFYQSAGTYDVTIRAVTFLGEESVSNAQIVAEGDGAGNIAPVANFQCYILEYTNVLCDGFGSFDPDGLIVSYEIDMGDGTTYSSDTANHTYLQSGSYAVTLKLIDNLGLQTISQTIVNVLENQNKAPIAYLYCDNSQPRKLTCDSSGSNDPDGFINKIEFSSENGIVKNAALPDDKVVFDYQAGGNKNVILKITDNEGRATEISQTFVVQENLNPIAKLNCNLVSEKTISCDASASSDPEGTILSFSIQYDTEGFATEAIGQHTFNSFGKKVIFLKVTDQDGFCSESKVMFDLLNYNDAPLAEFKIEINHDTKEVAFDGTSSTSNGKIVTEYRWDFNNDGIIDLASSEPKATFVYNEFISYTASLAVADSQNRLSSSSKSFKIIEMPVPDPGLAGTYTIEGIDSDSDGVRDDVQREIISIVATGADIGDALTQLAKNHLAVLNANDNKVVIIEQLKESSYSTLCLGSKGLSDTQLEEVRTNLLSQIYNTKDRFVAYALANEQFSGESVTISGDADASSYCK